MQKRAFKNTHSCWSEKIGNILINNEEVVVDGWMEKYVDNIVTGETDLIDVFMGEVAIIETRKQNYLGFVISSEKTIWPILMHLKGNKLE